MSCPNCGVDNAAGARFCEQCGASLSAAESTPAAPAGTGLQKNVAGLLCYLLGWLTGIVFFIIEKDPFVRFHAMQSIITFGGLTGISIILSILTPLGLWRLWALVQVINFLLTSVSIVLWVLLMVKAYQGERFKLPVAGDLAERYAGR